jgi:hypothetical protein
MPEGIATNITGTVSFLTKNKPGVANKDMLILLFKTIRSDLIYKNIFKESGIYFPG